MAEPVTASVTEYKRPKEFGPWQVIGVLKEKVCYKVRLKNQPKGLTYALKKPFPQGSTDGDHYYRFKKEVESLKGLDHPNVLRLIDYDLNPLNPYFVTRYCEGGSLDKVDFSRWNKGNKSKLCREICRGYAYLHQQGIVKGDNDLKNIFLLKKIDITNHPIPVIGDFEVCYNNNRPYRIGEVWYNLYKMFNTIKEA